MRITTALDSYFIPCQKNSDYKSQPLVIILHGKGDSLKPFKTFQDEIGLPQFNFLLVNAPNRFDTGYSWYGEPPYQDHGVAKARALLDSLIEEIILNGWKAKNIFLMGFSQGALMVSQVALHSKHIFAGVIGVSGYFHFSPRWRNEIPDVSLRTPWLFTHGRKDDILPIEDTKLGVRKLSELGVKIDWVESDKKHVFDERDYREIRKWILLQSGKKSATARWQSRFALKPSKYLQQNL